MCIINYTTNIILLFFFIITKQYFMKNLPHNIEAEQNILGLILNNNKYLNKIVNSLQPKHFYLPVHSEIYYGVKVLFNKGLVSDIITIKNYFNESKFFYKIKIKSYEYLLKIVANAKLNSDIYSLYKIVHNNYIKRQLIYISEECIVRATSDSLNYKSEKILRFLEEKISDLNNFYNNYTNCYSLIDSVKQTLSKIKVNRTNNKNITGIDTGFYDLNKITGGLQKSDLIIIAGRPSMGKTAFSINIAINAAKKFLQEYKSNNVKLKSVCFFSLEMSINQLAIRILSMETKINSERIKNGKISQNELNILSEQVTKLNNIPMLIDDTSCVTILNIKNKIKKMKKNNNLSLLIIDYLQLITPPFLKKENKVQEIAEISKELKLAAKELNIPILVISQLSRAVETREDKKPLLSDLRDSGNIEQDADIVIFIYREEYYLIRNNTFNTTTLTEWREKLNTVSNLAEIIISKQRNGPIGSFYLNFDKKTTVFSNLK